MQHRPKNTVDKRVFDIAASLKAGGEQRVLAISADSTVLDLYLALLGAFRWRGDYDLAEQELYRVVIGSRVFEFGKGTRTALRRVLDVGNPFSVTAGGLAIDAKVIGSYVVQSRRHFPKVLEGSGVNFDSQSSTWSAQSAMRREYRGRGAIAPLLDAQASSPEHTDAHLHGFFSGIVSGPMIMPSEWLSRVTDLRAMEDLDAVRTRVSGIMKVYNAVARQLYEERDQFIATVEAFSEVAQGEGSIAWARGYFDAVAMRAQEWEAIGRDEETRKLMMPIGVLNFECGRDPNKRAWLHDAEFRGNLSHASALAAIGIWEAWRGRLHGAGQPVRRSEPKISPNAPCPCGSGKKYKRCCGSPLRLVKS